jgi:glycosyltransferase involved in cell wall biosynthesis
VSRVLLLCPEPLGHSHPAGVGIRFLEFSRLLCNEGHRVVVLSPDGGGIAGVGAEKLSPEAIGRRSRETDLAIVQGHVANDFFVHATPVPTVVDFYDPYLIENFHYYSTRGPEVFAHDHGTMIRSAMGGDFFLCASQAQRLFYLGFFAAIGRLNPIVYAADATAASLVAVVPFGVQPLRPAGAKRTANPALLFGGIYDWYDPILAIESAALAARKIPELTLTFTRHPNPDITPQGAAAEAMAHVRRRGLEKVVRFEPWSAYDERAAFMDRFGLALLTFHPSIETDLSMRTRIFDYLWGGLPVVTSSAPGTDEILERYGAGTVVRSSSPEEFARHIVDLLGDESRYAAMQSGARRFASEHQWSRVAKPLLDFCGDPRVDSSKGRFARQPDLQHRRSSILDRLRRRIGGQA